jgi:hypothetical protein
MDNLMHGFKSVSIEEFLVLSPLDDSLSSIANTLEIMSVFGTLHYLGMHTNATDGIDIIL